MARIVKFAPILLLAIPAVMMLAQCSKSNDVDDPPTPPDPLKPFLTVTQTLPASFDSSGGSASIIFSTNESWEITIEPIPEKNSTQTALAPPENPSADTIAVVTARNSATAANWYAVTPLSGIAGKDLKVTVSVQPNEEYEGRGIRLVLRSESMEERIELTQLKKNAIIAGDNRREITSEQQPLTVKVQSNVTYSVVVKQGDGWIGENPKSRTGGLNEQEHAFTIAANPDAEERTGIIVFQDADSDLFDELTIIQAAWSDPDPERAALKAIYDAAGGNGWTQQENWCSDKPLSEWYGVQTDTDGNVTALRLPKNNLMGTVSGEISKLTKLRHLDLSHNALEGPISVSEGANTISYLDFLTALETINLSHNRIEGGYLPDLNNLNQLQYLNLSSNRITSWIPSWRHLFENGRTVELILNNNYLYDKVPDVIQSHPQWNRLALQIIRQYQGLGTGISYTKDIRLPDFTFTDLRDGSQGSIREVYSANTRTMLLTWNPLQEDSNTFLETTIHRVHTLYGQQGLAVVTITPEGDEYREAAQAYLRLHDMPGPVVTDYADMQGRRIVLPEEPYPSYFLVDQYGTISNDMFTGQYCPDNLYPEEPAQIDLTKRPFQHTDNLNKVLKEAFGNSKYQSSDFSMDKKYETLQRATKGKGIEIVLIGEAYTDVDIATGYYKQVMEFAKEALFAIEPMKSYRDYFNVHLVYAVSRDAFISKSGGSTALGVEIDNSDWFYVSTAMYYLPDYCKVVPKGNYIPTVGVVVNGANGGVTTLEHYMLRPNYAFTGFIHGNRRRSRDVFIHETVGHGFGLLGDEYLKYGNDGTPQEEIPESEKEKLRSAHNKGWFLNLSLTDDPKSVYWSHLIGHPQYSYVGIYQGGYYYAKGIWKSENYSLMDDESNYYFNTICRELIVKSTLEWAGEEYTFEKFLAKDSDEGRQKSTFQNSQLIQKPQNRHQPPIIRDLTDR